MTRFRGYSLFLLSPFFLWACSGNTAGKTAAHDSLVVPQLSGSIYHFPPEPGMDTTNCLPVPSVEGPDLYMIFTDANNFFSVNELPHALDLRKGKYHWNNNQLILNYDSLSVSREDRFEEQKNSRHGNSFIMSYTSYYFSSHKKRSPEQYVLMKCGNTPYLRLSDNRGMQDTSVSTLQMIERLKKDSAWILLKY